MEMQNDRYVRSRAIYETKRSFIVTAPAGSGKTQLIIKRYLNLLSESNSIKKIVCLTYTRKAAEEMRKRVFEALNECKEREPVDENERELFELAKKVHSNSKIDRYELLDPFSYRISTFHSFCSEHLKTLFKMDNVSSFELLDEIETSLLYDKIADIVIDRGLKGSDGELKEVLARRLSNLDAKSEILKKEIIKLLSNRLKLRFVDFQNWIDLLQSEIKKIFEPFLNFLMINYHFFVQKNIIEGDFDFNNIVVNENFFEFFGKIAKKILTKNNTLRRNLDQEVLDKLNEEKEVITFLKIIQKLKESDCRYFVNESQYTSVLTIMKYSFDILKEMLGKAKKDYDALEESMLENLKWIKGVPSNLLEKLQFTIDHILVDEAQDLSDAEYLIISRLIEDWEENDGRTIFFVGDPKQSIYKFRKANVALFKVLEEKGVLREGKESYRLEKLVININFRSEKGIIDFTNGVFKEYFEENILFDDIAYGFFKHPTDNDNSPMQFFTRERLMEDNNPIKVVISEDKEKLKRTFCKIIKRILSNRESNETVGILYKKRSDFVPYFKILQENGIQIEVIEGENLKESPVSKHLLNFLKAILFPYEDLHIFLMLGNPIFNLSPKEIEKLSYEKGDNWIDKFLNSKMIDKDKKQIFSDLVNSIYYNENKFLDGFIKLNGFEKFKSIYGIGAIDEIIKFFELYKENAHYLPLDMVERLEFALEKEYVPPLPLSANRNIQAMTIHKAKGLEFDYVIVLGLDNSPLMQPSDAKEPLIIERTTLNEVDGLFNFIIAPYDRNSYLYKFIEELSKKRTLSEYKRLCYVAITRAKKELYLLGNPKSNSFLKYLQTKYELSQETQDERFEEEEERFAEFSNLNLHYDRFEGEEVGYKIKRASDEVDFSYEHLLSFRLEKEDERDKRIKGIIVHNILEKISKGVIVDKNYIKKLKREMCIKLSENEIEEILNEANNCFENDQFKSLISDGMISSELPLEMVEGDKEILIGRVDLLIEKSKEVVLIDFKTSFPPTENVEKWIEEKKEYYRAQMEYYKKMASNFFENKRINAYLFFTKLNRLVEV